MTDHPEPPFETRQQSFPGRSSRMDPKPDHGEASYRGTGELEGKRALVTGAGGMPVF